MAHELVNIAKEIELVRSRGGIGMPKKLATIQTMTKNLDMCKKLVMFILATIQTYPDLQIAMYSHQPIVVEF